MDASSLQRELMALGLPEGAIVIVHSSLSAFGDVDGGAQAVVAAVRQCVGTRGTIVVPTFTPQVADPCPLADMSDASCVDNARANVPLYHDGLPTPMGAVANAILADPHRLRGHHPQASVAAVGAHAREITAEQPLLYALGKHSPFERMYRLGAYILLLGVGHNRNSFLHYAESLVPQHRRKTRRFPYVIHGERVWVETPDVGDDNGTYFPRVGAEAQAEGLVRTAVVGQATCQLMQSVPFVDFAKDRFATWLAQAH
jgi:aminoglycoside 3-N-acetyltransferase